MFWRQIRRTAHQSSCHHHYFLKYCKGLCLFLFTSKNVGEKNALMFNSSDKGMKEAKPKPKSEYQKALDNLLSIDACNENCCSHNAIEMEILTDVLYCHIMTNYYNDLRISRKAKRRTIEWKRHSKNNTRNILTKILNYRIGNISPQR